MEAMAWGLWPRGPWPGGPGLRAWPEEGKGRKRKEEEGKEGKGKKRKEKEGTVPQVLFGQRFPVPCKYFKIVVVGTGQGSRRGQ